MTSTRLLAASVVGLTVAACGSATPSESPNADGVAGNGQAEGGAGVGPGAGGANQGGSGASGFNNGGTGAFEGCAKQKSGGELVPLDLVLQVDQSASMQQNNKWEKVVAALDAFVKSPDVAGISVSLQYFPLDANPQPKLPAMCTSDAQCLDWGPCVPLLNVCAAKLSGGPVEACTAKEYSVPEIPMAPLPGVQPKVSASLAKHQPTGDTTPTEPALAGALTYATQHAQKVPDHIVAVVFATDGEPTGCTKNTAEGAAKLAEAAAKGNPPVKTFVIGVGSFPSLNQIAKAGGTEKAVFVDVGSETTEKFIEALNAIRGQVACQYQVPKTGPGGSELDYTLVNVQITPAGGTAETLKQAAGVIDCANGGGWYYDNPANPKKIVLCESTCAKLKMEKGSQVEIVYGCKTVVK